MNPSRLIARKRDGLELSHNEIASLISGFCDGTVSDSQMSAFCMAVFFRGMTDEETSTLTQEMLASGVTMSHPAESVVVDKHSTGGVGDKTSLILAPLLASCGLRIPMISGRGLGPTGGTLDKLESIPGFRTDLSLDEVGRILDEVGCVITGATADLVPADRRIYALRDVTATVPSIPLITASIMSKKLAESLGALVLDVKFGSGSFMKTKEQATELAESLVRVGELSGVRTVALLTDMNQPLGRACGNAIEVAESIAVLSGRGPLDVRELTLKLGAELLVAAGKSKSNEDAERILARRLDSGVALEIFRKMVAAQGGRLDQERPVASATPVYANKPGFVSAIDTELLGHVIIELGGGRQLPSDTIDHRVGLEMHVRIGDRVERDSPIVTVFSDRIRGHLLSEVRSAISLRKEPVEPIPLIADRVAQGS